MDWFKIQAQLLQEYGELKKDNRAMKAPVTEHDDYVYASVNGRWFAIIPANMWALKLPTIEKFDAYKKMLKSIEREDIQIVEVSDVTKKCKGFTAVQLSCNKFNCWVNKKYLSLFGRTSQLKLMTSNEIPMVYIYDAFKNELIGCIGQIRFQK